MIQQSLFPTKDIILFSSTILLQFSLSFINIFIQKYILADINDWFVQKAENNKLILDKSSSSVLYRNIDLFIDNYFLSLNFLLTLGALTLTLAFYTYHYGLFSVFIIISLLSTSPLIKFLTKKADYHYKHVQRLTDMRMKLVSELIKMRRLAHSLDLFQSFRVKLFEKVLLNENIRRNLDSMYRCLEIYLETFVKVLPPLVFLITFNFFFKDNNFNISEVFWVSLPLISTLFTLPRGITSLKTKKRCLEVIKNHFSTKSTLPSDKLTVTDQWEIWTGNLKENLLIEEENNYNELAEITNLNNEIGLEKVILTNGKNISAGQKTRIIISRAINLAISTNKELIVNMSFDSLDNKNKDRIQSLFRHFSNSIKITLLEKANNSLQSKVDIEEDSQKIDSSSSKHKAEDKVVYKNHTPFEILISLFKDFKLWFFLFLAAAFCNASLYSQVGSFNLTINTIFITTLLIIIGLILTSTGGYFLEKSIRDWASLKLFKSIQNRTISSEELKKIANVEYLNVIEKLSFYTHDLAWICALFVVAFISIFISSGVLAFIPASFMLIAFISIYLNMMPKLKFARENYVSNAQKLINSLNDLAAIETIEDFTSTSYNKHKLTRKIFFPNLKNWFHSKYHLIRWKTILSISGKLSIGFIFIALMLIFKNANISNEIVALAFGALMAIDKESIRLFAAFSGYSVQLKAEDALRLGAEEKLAKETHFALSQNFIALPSFQIKNINKMAGPTQYNFDVYKIHADSGEGKSSYMKSILKMSYNCSEINVAYIPQDGLKGLTWYLGKTMNSIPHLWESMDKLKGKGFNLFLLDETLLDYELSTTETFFKEAVEWSKMNKVTILFADHRVNAKNIVTLNSILK